jgi:hypothetical protein
MIRTVNEAFNFFLKEYVNLDSIETQLARNSRDWLLLQICLFPVTNKEFPRLYPGKHIYFGSFARRTKKRVLDDIDMMITLNGEGAYYKECTNKIEIYVSDSASQLRSLCWNDTNILNSRKVIGKFIDLLSQVQHYNKAEIKRNMEAAILNLKSYTWTFDIVPCFITQKDEFNKDYYLIPDGQGYWKKTDPRIDKDRVTEVNQFHDGNVLNIIRLMKYWNRRATMPSMPSYLIENMILDYYSVNTYPKSSSYVDLEIPKLLQYISGKVFSSVHDPKGIQGNINTLNSEEQIKISARAMRDYQKALEARQLETQGNHKLSILRWGDIFGSNFPQYTS